MTASRSEHTRGIAPALASSYRHIFIVDARSWFASCRGAYSPSTDLVLTYDFALVREIRALGGEAYYVDHLLDASVMHAHNERMYEFFRNWHRGPDGEDLFTHDGVAFGLSFRLDYWNDYVFFVRCRVCLHALRDVGRETLFVGTSLGLIEEVFGGLGTPFVPVSRASHDDQPAYYFPIHRWMNDNIRRTGVRARVINAFSSSLGTALSWLDRLRLAPPPAVLVQDYHPTRELIQRLRDDARVRVVGTTVSRNHLWSRYIPIWSTGARFAQPAAELLRRFRERRLARLDFGDGLELTEAAYSVIEQRIAPRVQESLRILDAVRRYVARTPIRLEVLIANLGELVTLADCVCRSRGVPSYLIANGILATPFVDDSKHASVINAYGESVRSHYFAGMTNVVCRGDPRMDRYFPPVPRRVSDPDAFTVGIGASGHNNAELNSYVAVEFEFLDGALRALRRVTSDGADVRVILKVRGNGYVEQYRQFTAEYFGDMTIEIFDDAPMDAILRDSDFFISIYSQTLFEASCLGIPCAYFRVDDEIKFPPFDGASELVTVETEDALYDAICAFRRGDSRFDPFLDRTVMAQYVGPLDGGNLERNCEAVYTMLRSPAELLSA